MTNEIKEMNFSEMLFNRDERLLDYITNLQEENKQLRENNLSMQEEMCLRWNELDNLQQRIDKAIEYINTFSITVNAPIYRKILDINPEELLNILQGGE